MSKRYSLILFAALMSFCMSFSQSIAMVLIIGPLAEFWAKWPRAFLIGFAVSLPTSLLIVPVVRKVTNRLTGE
ncbi:MAG: DUF2798 domain-containing protein [Candidatus Bathyarchaeia archaeon]